MPKMLKVTFKVTRCHPRSNGLALLHGHESWWMASSLVDAKNVEGRFKVIGVTIVYEVQSSSHSLQLPQTCIFLLYNDFYE